MFGGNCVDRDEQRKVQRGSCRLAWGRGAVGKEEWKEKGKKGKWG